mgnify:CR=1 FL=1
MGEDNFKNFQKTANRVVLAYKIFVILLVLAATSGLPWYGDEYEVMIPVKIFTDVFGKWSFPFTTIFYLSLYHIAFTITGGTTIIVYLVLHLYTQCLLLNQRLENLSSSVDSLDVATLQTNEEYQNRVKNEMSCCIRHHQTLLK